MKILAINTSSPVCSVSLLEDDKVIKEIEINDVKTHSEKLMGAINKVLENTNTPLSSISLLACSIGPRVFYWS